MRGRGSEAEVGMGVAEGAGDISTDGGGSGISVLALSAGLLRLLRSPDGLRLFLLRTGVSESCRFSHSGMFAGGFSELVLVSSPAGATTSCSPLTSASPLIFRDSATFNKGPICSWDTFISPLYMNSTAAFSSGHFMSLIMTMGCWQGFSKKRDWK